MSDDQKKTMGRQLNNTLIFCKLSLVPCDEIKQFQYYYDFTYGNCYKFNAGGLQTVGKNGLENSLQFEIYVGNSSLTESYTRKRGGFFYNF